MSQGMMRTRNDRYTSPGCTVIYGDPGTGRSRAAWSCLPANGDVVWLDGDRSFPPHHLADEVRYREPQVIRVRVPPEDVLTALAQLLEVPSVQTVVVDPIEAVVDDSIDALVSWVRKVRVMCQAANADLILVTSAFEGSYTDGWLASFADKVWSCRHKI